MSADDQPTSRPAARRPRPAILAIALTAAACLTAIGFRTPLRCRYWAWCVERAASPAERAIYLGALCNAGAQGRWGTSALVTHPDPAVRQYGVLVLQHVRAPWARTRLLERLSDADPAVRRLAALGLAMHGDDTVIPTLTWLYQAGDADSADAACLAFERLGTPAAMAALNDLVLEPADTLRCARLIDALAGIGRVECMPALVHLLSDQRACDLPLRSEERSRQALDAIQAQGYAPTEVPRPFRRQGTDAVAGETPSSVFEKGGAPAPATTIAERAAEALARISGVIVPFSSAAAEDERRAARQQWADWYAAQRMPK